MFDDLSGGQALRFGPLGDRLEVVARLRVELDDFEMVAQWAEAAGLPAGQIVKHYAEGPITGTVASVIGRKNGLRAAAESDDPFLMETDFIDDPDRPGAVLGPKTVPRRVNWLREEGYDAAVRRAHVETPAAVYGIDTERTLADA